jgi:hypothetical protein
MSNNNNSNNNRRNGRVPRPFPFNTQPFANDPIWGIYGHSMPNGSNNGFPMSQLAQSYPATPTHGTLEYTVPPSPPRLARSTGFPRSRSASMNSTASNNSTGTTNPAPVPFANLLAAIPENNESVNMLAENENGELSITNEEYSNNNSNYNSNNENPKPLRKKVKLTTNGNAHGGKRSAKRSAKRSVKRSARRSTKRSTKRHTHRAPRK